jgi:MerR family copper efflux transcriptional regulator
MKIGELATATGLTADTLRFYEKLLVLDPPVRQANGYRRYSAQHLERVKFVQSAKALGFSLAEIVSFIPRLAVGEFKRADIEHELKKKVREVNLEVEKLKDLKRNLINTISALSCEFDASLSTGEATIDSPGDPIRVRRLKRTQTA